MKRSQIRTAIKDKENAKTINTRYCLTHYVDAIEYNNKIVCGFCRNVPDKIVHYHTEAVDDVQKTVFYKLCPVCGDLVRIVRKE